MSKSMRIQIEVDVHAVTCPGVWFACKSPVYLSICFLGFHVRTKPFPANFPLLFADKFIFEKTFPGKYVRHSNFFCIIAMHTSIPLCIYTTLFKSQRYRRINPPAVDCHPWTPTSLRGAASRSDSWPCPLSTSRPGNLWDLGERVPVSLSTAEAHIYIWGWCRLAHGTD